jgi:hypothetical protein
MQSAGSPCGADSQRVAVEGAPRVDSAPSVLEPGPGPHVAAGVQVIEGRGLTHPENPLIPTLGTTFAALLGTGMWGSGSDHRRMS